MSQSTCFKETELGEIPEEWEVKRLGEVANIFDHLRIPLSEKQRESMKGEYPYCGANGIIDYINDYIFDGEYVLLAEDGGYWGAFEPSAYIMQGKFWVNNHAHVLQGKDGILLNRFLVYALNFFDLTGYVSGTTRGKLTQTEMKKILIPLPPLEEQKRIAGVLRLVDEIIERTRQIVSLYEKAKKYALSHLLTKGIGHTRFKQTELGEIPEEWEEKRLEEVAARVYSGSSAPQEQKYFEGGIYPFVRVQDLARYGQTRNLLETVDKVNDMAVRELSLVLAPRGTIVFPKSGAALEKNHRAILGTDAYIVSHLAAVEVNHEVADTEFVFWWLCKVDMAAINPNPGYPSIRLQEIKALPIPLPPLEEQKRIAGVLRLVDEIIERTRQIVSLYEKAKKYALSHLLTKGIGHTRFKQTELGEIPEEWEEKRLEEVAARVYSGSSAPQEQKYFEGGIYPFVRVQDLARYGQTRNLLETVDKVNDMAVRELSLVLAPRGTIVFPKSGAALEKNHRAILGTDAYIVSHLAAVEVNHEVADTEFVFWWLCKVDMAAINPNPGYPSIRLQEIKALPIPLPPLEEQKRIAEILSTIDKAIDNERRYLEALGKLKKWLLNNLLTGKVRLPEWVGDILKQVFPEG